MTNQPVQQKQPFLFINHSVRDYKILMNGAATGIQIAILDADRNSVLQIAGTLNPHSNAACVGTLAHGNQGQVYPSYAKFSPNTLNTYQTALQTWGNALSQIANIFFYGCNSAKGVAQ